MSRDVGMISLGGRRERMGCSWFVCWLRVARYRSHRRSNCFIPSVEAFLLEKYVSGGGGCRDSWDQGTNSGRILRKKKDVSVSKESVLRIILGQASRTRAVIGDDRLSRFQ